MSKREFIHIVRVERNPHSFLVPIKMPSSENSPQDFWRHHQSSLPQASTQTPWVNEL